MVDILKFNLSTSQSCKAITTINNNKEGSIEIIANEDCLVSIAPDRHIKLKKGMRFILPVIKKGLIK